MDITIDKGIKISVVPQYFPLRRKTGQLLKDFGLDKYQRKEVLNQITKFMHFNSHQYVLGKTAPSEPRTHNSGLRKSRSLGSIHTIKQDLLTCPLPLTNTDSESDDDTTPPLTHTTTHTQPALNDSNQSHANGAVVININTVNETESPKVKQLEEHIEVLENQLNDMFPPILSEKLRTKMRKLNDRNHKNDRWIPFQERDSIKRQYDRYQQERSEYLDKRHEVEEELKQAKEDVHDLKQRLHKQCVKSKELEDKIKDGIGNGNTEPPAVEVRSTPADSSKHVIKYPIIEDIFNNEYNEEQRKELVDEIIKYTDCDSFWSEAPSSVLDKWFDAAIIFARKYQGHENEFEKRKIFFAQCLEHSKV